MEADGDPNLVAASPIRIGNSIFMSTIKYEFRIAMKR